MVNEIKSITRFCPKTMWQVWTLSIKLKAIQHPIKFLSDIHQDKCCSVSIDMGKICVFLRNISIPISIYQIPHERRQGQFETHSRYQFFSIFSFIWWTFFQFSHHIRISIFTYIWYDIQGRHDITSLYAPLLKYNTKKVELISICICYRYVLYLNILLSR